MDENEFDFENRIMSSSYDPQETENENTLRPQTLDEYIGQEKAKANLKIIMEAAKLRGEQIDHVLLYGPPGLGKTTLSAIIASEMGVNLRITSGPAIEKKGDLVALLAGLQEGDVLFISEKCVACTQKRAIYMKDIKPRRLAVILSHYVTKTPHGIGLGIPETMEMALRECGTLRILFAAVIGAIGKIFGKRGWFYIVAGPKASSIDGPCHNTIPPYNECVVLGPLNPNETAADIAKHIGHPVLIVDINDLGGNILGASDPAADRDLYARILKDNPLGQSRESTPMGIIRKAD